MIEGLRRARPAFLVSVTSADEAELALRGGADVIDCKDPEGGALGALAAETVCDVVLRVARRLPVSATIGDLPSSAGAMVRAASAMASTGVDIVKVGFFADGDPVDAIAALGRQDLGPARLVAVLMADLGADFTLIPALSVAGFVGVMLDTADKSAGRLTGILPENRLREFVQLAHSHGLFAGLAGSLRLSDVARLAQLEPDVLGFRGALCAAGRASAVDPDKIARIRFEINETRPAKYVPEKSLA
jgi:uncharacterized protein (UPF0264 family)